MRRGRDQADLALGVAVRVVVGAHGQQAGQLALGAGVRLDRDGVVAGDLDQLLLQLADQGQVALGLLDRGEGCSWPNSGQVTASISVVALSFMVQEPSGIMPRSSA